MFDTIVMTWPLRLQRSASLPGWRTHKSENITPTASGPPETRLGSRYDHLDSGLKAFGSGSLVHRVQCSLPRLLFGTNARLITSQAHVDEALAIAEHISRELGIPLGGIEKFTRVDLTWHFRLDPRLVILAHKHARHPRIRSNAGHYFNESLHWYGKYLKARIYDKLLEQTRHPGDVTRAEFELHGPLIGELLSPDGQRVRHLDFSTAYQAYRELMLGFAPFNVPRISEIAELLAVADAGHFRYRGLSMFELWAVGKNPEHVRKVQKQLAALRPRYFEIDWAQLLPPDGPPEAVDVDTIDPEVAT